MPILAQKEAKKRCYKTRQDEKALAAQPNDLAHKLRAGQREFKTKCTTEIDQLKTGREGRGTSA
ncbi:hypothetical protein [Fodinibius salsisoli]|uniref:Uncharacterized protein n=1 Tax=Fodinibius salsisoli TaxID=2820877 RepID=A0ABT3PKR8_9BACT|nr:hypothetical protein [Fodinibius salsisoli]MCW9706530.1 hypothetical protein [Fodinibius salsisoli]